MASTDFLQESFLDLHDAELLLEAIDADTSAPVMRHHFHDLLWKIDSLFQRADTDLCEKVGDEYKRRWKPRQEILRLRGEPGELLYYAREARNEISHNRHVLVEEAGPGESLGDRLDLGKRFVNRESTTYATRVMPVMLRDFAGPNERLACRSFQKMDRGKPGIWIELPTHHCGDPLEATDARTIARLLVDTYGPFLLDTFWQFRPPNQHLCC